MDVRPPPARRMQLKPAVMRPRPLPAAHTAAASVAIVALAACHFERAATVLAPPAPNQPPVADPGGPYTGGDTAAISFDGTRSFDPDSDMPLATHNRGYMLMAVKPGIVLTSLR